MIIASEISKALEGFTINIGEKTIDVKNTIGDQDALDMFISEYDKRGLEKFPLVFIVVAKTTGEELLQSKRQIVIMTKTSPDWLGKDRNANIFEKVIHPIYNKLIPLIDSYKGLKIIGDRKTRIDFIDKLNFGVSDNGIGKKKSTESTITDYIDARIIDLTIEYNNAC